MTLYDDYKTIYENFQLLGYFLIQKLRICEINETSNKSFDQLIERVADIRAVPHINRYNAPPGEKPDLIIDQTLSDFNISLAKRVRYYENFLAYHLVLKGVSRVEVNKCKTLAELINLIDTINIIKNSTLSLTTATFSNNQYTLPNDSYGHIITIPYILHDNDNNNINEGNITLKCNGVLYSSITAGETLNFMPPSISPKENGEYQPYTLEIEYHGTNQYASYGPIYANIIIHPSSIHLDIDIVNITNHSKYTNSPDTGSENDKWRIQVTTTSNNNILPNIPINVTANNTNIKSFITNEDGTYIFEHTFSQANNYLLKFISNYSNTEELINTTEEYTILIKYNLLYQASDTYTQYAGQTYSYSIEIHDEDTNEITNAYDGTNIICVDGDDNIPITIVNGTATYNKEILSADEYTLQWILNDNNSSTSTNTNIIILSNFILPDEISFFLNNTPDIYYTPLGNETINKKVDVTISSIVLNIEQTELVINGEIQYQKDENDEYVLDENGDKIPIMTEEVTESVIEEIHEYYYTNAIGKLHNFNELLSPGKYDVILTTASDNLNETVHYTYELKRPLMLDLVDYRKTSYATYELTIYDIDNADSITYTMTNNNNDISNLWSITTLSNDNAGYITKMLTLTLQNDSIGLNLLQATLNDYTTEASFQLFDNIFALLTPSVEVDESQIQIICYDESIEDIQINGIESSYIELIIDDNNQRIFYVDIFTDTVGTINFTVIGDNEEEGVLTLTVTKKDISDFINANISIFTEDNDEEIEESNDEETDILEFTTLDMDKVIVNFNIAINIYKNLNISYYYQQKNHAQVLYDTFTYDTNDNITTSNNEDTLSFPTSIVADEYNIIFISNGNSNYYPFTKTIPIHILKATPTLDINIYSVYDNNDYGILTLNATSSTTETSLTAQYTNQAKQPLSNKLITFYMNENPIEDTISSLNNSSVVTDNNGQATITYPVNNSLQTNIRAVTNNISSNSILFNNIRSAILRANMLYTSIDDDNSSLTIETKDPTTVYNINDLQNIIVDMAVDNNDDWTHDSFSSNNTDMLTEEEAQALNNALVEYVDENGEIKITLLGDLQ